MDEQLDLAGLNMLQKTVPVGTKKLEPKTQVHFLFHIFIGSKLETCLKKRLSTQ